MFCNALPKITSAEPLVNQLFHVRDAGGWHNVQFVFVFENYFQLRMGFPSVWLQCVFDGGPPHMYNATGGWLQPFNEMIPFN